MLALVSSRCHVCSLWHLADATITPLLLALNTGLFLRHCVCIKAPFSSAKASFWTPASTKQALDSSLPSFGLLHQQSKLWTPVYQSKLWTPPDKASFGVIRLRAVWASLFDCSSRIPEDPQILYQRHVKLVCVFRCAVSDVAY